MAAECPAVLGTRWRRLPAVASGNYYYNHYDEVLNGAGSTLTVPGFGLKNGVHPRRRRACPCQTRRAKTIGRVNLQNL